MLPADLESKFFAGSLFIVIAFILLLFLSHFIYVRYFHRIRFSIATGSAVLALNTYALVCLPSFRLSQPVLMLAALELFIIWIYISVSLLQIFLSGEKLVAHQADRLSTGYWVAGTILMALMFDRVEQTLHGFIVFLSLLSAVWYGIYLIIFMRWLFLCLRKRFHLHTDGMIFLAAVSTQAMVLLMTELFRDDVSAWAYQLIIGCGFVFFFAGLVSLVWHSLAAHARHLAAGWPNVNSLIHGALSITGLAMVSSLAYPEWSIVGLWWCALVFLLIVEGLEFSRLLIRLRRKGFWKGLCVYHVTQWPRLFAFGVFYGFGLSCYNKGYTTVFMISFIANYGQYILTALLIAQLAVVMRHVVKQETIS
ncbi:hypothetical protein AQUSIP_21140 [Aquicella siphonis]|uniref:Voltage-dependent anion channel n=2 Tax=Aquicella siphonis TaxID=254247 RepID=A0A5E4PK31_9COXI|nr:hypothetical protein AQUSIP_21140 [Aquicella siphonis]